MAASISAEVRNPGIRARISSISAVTRLTRTAGRSAPLCLCLGWLTRHAGQFRDHFLVEASPILAGPRLQCFMEIIRQISDRQCRHDFSLTAIRLHRNALSHALRSQTPSCGQLVLNPSKAEEGEPKRLPRKGNADHRAKNPKKLDTSACAAAMFCSCEGKAPYIHGAPPPNHPLS